MMEEKKVYQKAVAEVILFDNSDVITTSGMDGENTYCMSGYDRPGSGCQDGSHDGQVQ